MIDFPDHTLIIGATGSGKGVLCHSTHEKWLAADPKHKVFLLCNKQNEYERYKPHPRLFATMDQYRYLEELQQLQSPKEGCCDTMAVIDEAFAWTWKKKAKDEKGIEKEIGLQYVANAARAHGVFMWVTSQFPTQMAPTVRANCDNIYCFKQRPDGAEWAAKQYDEIFINSKKIQKGYFIHQTGTDEPVTGCAWYKDESGKFIKA